MNGKLRQQVVDLRTTERLSYSAIVKKLGVPKSTLSYWLRDFPLTKEEILELRRKNWKNNEAKIELFRATMRKKREVKDRIVYEKYLERFKRISDETFFTAGLVLYMAEGSKTDESIVSVVNTNPAIIRFFIKWLEKFLNITPDQLRVHLQLYENMDIGKEIAFWENETGFKHAQFYKPFIRKLSPSSFTYRGSFRHGTCGIYLFGIDRHREIMMAIKAFLDQTVA